MLESLLISTIVLVSTLTPYHNVKQIKGNVEDLSVLADKFNTEEVLCIEHVVIVIFGWRVLGNIVLHVEEHEEVPTECDYSKESNKQSVLSTIKPCSQHF